MDGPPRTKKKAKERRAKTISTHDCIIPPVLPKEDLYKLLFRQSGGEAQRIREKK